MNYSKFNFFEKSILIGALSLSVFTTGILSAANVTIYNSNLGLVREKRDITLKSGLNTISINDVASGIDATSVHFKSLTDPEKTTVLEQNFQYDLLSQEKLLDKYIGKEIQLESWRGVGGDKKEIIKGILLSNQGGRILKVGDQIMVNPIGNPILPALPEGLVLKPTLLWKISAERPGKHEAEISYLTSGMGWNADYVLLLNTSEDKLDLNSWVTINNQSGASFKGADLKLVAGDVNRVENRREDIYLAAKAMRANESNSQFSEKSFFEYHLYTLGRQTDLLNNETKQIELASAIDVPTKKRFVYDGAQNIYGYDYSEYTRTDPGYGTQGDTKVWVTLEFKNSKDKNLGMPLPKGRIRVYKKDTDGAVEFIGEDSIDHTPKDEEIHVKMGKAFDVVGGRTRTDYKSDIANRTFTETFEIKLRNHKDSDVVIDVVEHLYRWTNWKISDASHKWEKKNAQTINFNVAVPKNGTATVVYTVKYSW